MDQIVHTTYQKHHHMETSEFFLRQQSVLRTRTQLLVQAEALRCQILYYSPGLSKTIENRQPWLPAPKQTNAGIAADQPVD
jgi:hypothetical protein